MSVLTPPPVQPPDYPGQQYQPTPQFQPPQKKGLPVWAKVVLVAVGCFTLLVVIGIVSRSSGSSSGSATPATPVATAPVSTAPSLTYSADQIVAGVTGYTAQDGTTATSVSVVGTPTEAAGGLYENAQLDVTFSDGTTYRMSWVLTVATDNWVVNAEYQE